MPDNREFRVRWETWDCPREMGLIDVIAHDAQDACAAANRLLWRLSQSNKRRAHQWPVRLIEVTPKPECER